MAEVTDASAVGMGGATVMRPAESSERRRPSYEGARTLDTMIVVPWSLTFRHGIGLIALAAVALGLSRHLQDPRAKPRSPGTGVPPGESPPTGEELATGPGARSTVIA